MMGFEHIRVDLSSAAVATLTLARPESLNALSHAMMVEVREAVLGLGPEVRCLLITGEGRGFCSGANLATDGESRTDLGRELETYFNPMIEAIFNAPVPVVAAVNGAAAGAGCSIALAADIAIASRSAYFLMAFANIGLIPDSGATWLLPRLVGRARAIEMMMLPERLSAEQAVQFGMISRLVEDEDLAAESVALATRLAQGPTVAFRLIRSLARNAGQLSFAEALAAEAVAQREAGRSEDVKAAVAAFLEKRKPQFRGR